MNTEPARLVAAGGDHAPATATANNQRAPLQPGIALTFDSYKKSIQIQVYDVSFHKAK